jgi:hypothetical protein
MIPVIAGLALTLLSVGAIYFSLPRDGKQARFVGSEWEGYIVIAMVIGFVGGVGLVWSGVTQLLS